MTMWKRQLLRMLIVVVICAGVLLLLGTLAAEIAEIQKEEGLHLMEDAVKNTAVTCYAIEGAYPESLAYMEEHYGLVIDRDRYIVHYEVFASNLMPVVTVLEKK